MKPQRKICDFTTSCRIITKVKANDPTSRIIGATNTIKHVIIDIDTHSDTIVFGQSFILLSETGRECDVSPYTDEYEEIKNFPIVLTETAQTLLELAETFIIIFHEGLWMNNTMEHTLVNPPINCDTLVSLCKTIHTVVLRCILNLRVLISCSH